MTKTANLKKTRMVQMKRVATAKIVVMEPLTMLIAISLKAS